MAQGLLKSNRDRDGLAAALLYNLGDLENGIYEVQEEWQEQKDKFDQMQAGFEAAGLRMLNRPNLLKQPTFTTRAYPSSPVIDYDITIPAETAEEAAVNLTYTVTNEAITSAYVLTGVTSRNYAIAGPWNMTCVASAGSAVITVGPRNEGAAHEALTVTAHLCTVANQTVPYGTTSRSYASGQPYLDSINDGSYPGHNNDEISESVVTLTGDDIITEPDGEVYNKAIAFTITNPPAQGWGNADRLIWNYGTAGRSIEMVDGAPKYRRYGEVDLIVGETYTLCCWARITNGSKAALWMGLPEYYKMTDAYAIKEIEAGGGKWQRVVFQFTFNPTGDQFYTYTYDNKTYQACNWTKRVIIGVCRKYAGTVQLCGFRLVRGKLWISETYDDINQGLDAVKDRVTALETRATALESRATALESRVTALENGKASSTNPSFSGTLTLDGVTLTPTELAELINSLEEVAPYDPETPAEPVEETEVEPSSP